MCIRDTGYPHNSAKVARGKKQAAIWAACHGQPDVSAAGNWPAIAGQHEDYLQQALIPMSSETHSGEDVAVYAKGPYAHLFDGTLEQNVIFHVMHKAVTAE